MRYFSIMSMLRTVIEIDENLCNGCERCILGCPEGAIQMVHGKAKLVNTMYCDGLGACVGECSQNAIKTIEREAAPYNERLVIANISEKGDAAVKQHLDHLQKHGQLEYLAEAQEYLAKSCLTHWPVQLHLINPQAAHFRDSDFLLCADCVGYAVGDFHQKFLKGKTVGIACPKLDQGKEIYIEKIRALVNESRIRTLTVMLMQVPCCRGLLLLAQQGVASAGRQIPIKAVTVGIKGQVLAEEWLT